MSAWLTGKDQVYKGLFVWHVLTVFCIVLYKGKSLHDGQESSGCIAICGLEGVSAIAVAAKACSAVLSPMADCKPVVNKAKSWRINKCFMPQKYL